MLTHLAQISPALIIYDQSEWFSLKVWSGAFWHTPFFLFCAKGEWAARGLSFMKKTGNPLRHDKRARWRSFHIARFRYGACFSLIAPCCKWKDIHKTEAPYRCEPRWLRYFVPSTRGNKRLRKFVMWCSKPQLQPRWPPKVSLPQQKTWMTGGVWCKEIEIYTRDCYDGDVLQRTLYTLMQQPLTWPRNHAPFFFVSFSFKWKCSLGFFKYAFGVSLVAQVHRFNEWLKCYWN